MLLWTIYLGKGSGLEGKLIIKNKNLELSVEDKKDVYNEGECLFCVKYEDNEVFKGRRLFDNEDLQGGLIVLESYHLGEWESELRALAYGFGRF